MRQIAPDPADLQGLVDSLVYKANFEVSLRDVDRGQGSEGLTLCILITTPDSYHPDTSRRVAAMAARSTPPR